MTKHFLPGVYTVAGIAYCSVKVMRVSLTYRNNTQAKLGDSLKFGCFSEVGFSFTSESLYMGHTQEDSLSVPTLFLSALFWYFEYP